MIFERFKIKLYLIIALTSMSIISSFVSAQPHQLEYRERYNPLREEGLEGTPTAQGNLKLLSAILFWQGALPEDRSENLIALWFYLQAPSTISITVSEYERTIRKFPGYNYAMRPSEKGYNPKNFPDPQFEWDARGVVDVIGLSIDDLYALAEIEKVRGEDISQIAPILIYRNPTMCLGEVENYRFVFVASNKADLVYKFIRIDDDTAIIYEDELSDRMPNRPIIIDWDGKDKDGQIAPEGMYQLKIDATFELGDRILSLPYYYNFYHKSSIR